MMKTLCGGLGARQDSGALPAFAGPRGTLGIGAAPARQ